MTKLRQGLIANALLISCSHISTGNSSRKRAYYLKHGDAHRENVIGEKRRFENRVAPPLSSPSSRRRAWSSEISDFSRARGWQIESPRTFARSEEDGKARKSRRAGLARGYREVRRYRESQPVRERKRVGGLDEGLGDVRAYSGIQGGGRGEKVRVDRRKGDERGGLNRRLRGTRSYLLVSQAKLPPPRRYASLSPAAPRYSITNSTVPVLARYSGPPDRPLSVADQRWHIGNANERKDRDPRDDFYNLRLRAR